MWAAHDDLWDNDWIGELVRGFKGNTGIAFGKLRKIGPADGAQEDFPDQVFDGGRMSRLARYILADEGRGKANLIYGLHPTAALRERALPVLNSSRTIAGLDMLVVFRCLEKGPVISVPSVWFNKRAPLAGPGNRGGAGLLRALTMWDRLSYVWACLCAAEGLATKVMIGALLPVKYLKAAYWSLRAVVAGNR
jgi:hypothetical protein